MPQHPEAPATSSPLVRQIESLLGALRSDRLTRVSETVWELATRSTTVQLIVAHELLVVTVQVLERAPERGREELFRTLLEANVSLLGAFFTLEANDAVRINQVFPIEWLQLTELKFLIGNVAGLGEEWAGRLRARAGEG